MPAPHPDPRTILLTGATDGIGRAAALELARLGHRVFVHGRSAARLDDTCAWIARECGSALLEPILADFSELAQVRAMVDEVRRRTDRLDVLIANAALWAPEPRLTVDGFETTWQVNHLAQLALTLGLLELMPAGSRIVNVGSTSHDKVKAVDLEALGGLEDFSSYGAYALSKLGQLAATLELAPRLDLRGITVNALHPGSLLTKLQLVGWGGGGSPDYGPAVHRILRLALAPELAGVTGQWFQDGAPRLPNPLLGDSILREALWEKSLAMIGTQAP